MKIRNSGLVFENQVAQAQVALHQSFAQSRFLRSSEWRLHCFGDIGNRAPKSICTLTCSIGPRASRIKYLLFNLSTRFHPLLLCFAVHAVFAAVPQAAYLAGMAAAQPGTFMAPMAAPPPGTFFSGPFFPPLPGVPLSPGSPMGPSGRTPRRSKPSQGSASGHGHPGQHGGSGAGRHMMMPHGVDSNAAPPSPSVLNPLATPWVAPWSAGGPMGQMGQMPGPGSMGSPHGGTHSMHGMHGVHGPGDVGSSGGPAPVHVHTSMGSVEEREGEFGTLRSC